MARLRAVVVIQPPGLGGTPSVGQRSAAMANASATASSARSMSPRTRIKVAVQRPASQRKISASACSSAIHHLHGAELDGALAGQGALAGPLEGGVEVGSSAQERKSGVEGKRGSGRGDVGGRGSIKQKKKRIEN